MMRARQAQPSSKSSTSTSAQVGTGTSSRRRVSSSLRRPTTTTSNTLSGKLCLLTTFLVALIMIWMYMLLTTLAAVKTKNGGGGSGSDANVMRTEELQQERDRATARRTTAIVQPATSTDQIVDTLMKLALMPSTELRELMEPTSSDDLFKLSQLKQGQCPWKNSKVLEWLPRRPPSSKQASEWFKNRHSNSDHHVVVYYEHLSKAGGTSFCKLAQGNMPKAEVPSYYCMPSEPKMPDARIGSWTLDKLQNYFKQTQPHHRLVSNEWEPFQHEFFKLQYMGEAPTDGLHLLFVTTIRNPINRLLSAYKFWGILNNPSPTKPSFETFIERRGRMANGWKILSGNFAANVGRFNFATWKFSGGLLGVSDLEMNFVERSTKDHLNHALEEITTYRQNMSTWKPQFEKSIRTLARFDLAIPMELLSEHPDGLRELVGWDNFSNSHVVNIGKVKNTDASTELNKEMYDVLWEANKLDFILHYWISAVYLTRLYC